MGACHVEVSTRNRAGLNANAGGNLDGGVAFTVHTPTVNVGVVEPHVSTNLNIGTGVSTSNKYI